MCAKKLLFSLSLFLFCSLLAFSQGGNSSPQGVDLSALLAQPLPEFPVNESLLSIPSPKQTNEQLTLNERTARQLEAWIAYQAEVKTYVLRVNSWSIKVTDSWNQVKTSSTNYESATQTQIKVRDTEIKRLGGNVVKYTIVGFLVGAAGGFIAGLLVH